VAEIPEFMQENKLPGGRVFTNKLMEQLNKELNEKYSISNIIVSDDNYQIHLNHPKLDSAKISKKDVTRWIVDRLFFEPGIARVFAIDDLYNVPLPPDVRSMLNNGYYPSRSGDIQVILRPGYIDSYTTTGTTHGLWNPYDSHIPLLWYGWGIKQGKTNKEVKMTDIAPTLAAMLRIQMPSGCVGKPIEDVLK
jgi:hypothetical protein